MRLTCRAEITPAGLLAIAALVSSVLLSTSVLVDKAIRVRVRLAP